MEKKENNVEMVSTPSQSKKIASHQQLEAVEDPEEIRKKGFANAIKIAIIAEFLILFMMFAIINIVYGVS